MPQDEEATPAPPKLQALDLGSIEKQGQDLALDWASRFEDKSLGMDTKEMARIQGLKSPEQQALEAQRTGIAGQLMSRGATGLMGDYMKYMRSQGMQTAAAAGTPTSGFGQAIATDLGANQLLQNQLLGANLTSNILEYNTREQNMARAPGNAVFQAGMPSQQSIFQTGVYNNDLANQQTMMDYENMVSNQQVGGGAGAGIMGGIQGAMQGAMAGAALGPWGAVGGAVIGGTAGGLSASQSHRRGSVTPGGSGGMGGFGGMLSMAGSAASMFGGMANSGAFGTTQTPINSFSNQGVQEMWNQPNMGSNSSGFISYRATPVPQGNWAGDSGMGGGFS